MIDESIVSKNLALVENYFYERSVDASLERERELRRRRNQSKKKHSSDNDEDEESSSKGQRAKGFGESEFQRGYASGNYYEYRLKDYFRRIYQTRDVIGNILSDYGVKLTPPQNQHMTLRKNQIAFNNAVALVFVKGIPYKFYTPEGEILLTHKRIRLGQENAKAVFDKIHRHFGLVFLPDYPHGEVGNQVDVYAFARDVNGKPLALPIPEEKPVPDCCNMTLSRIWFRTRPEQLSRPTAPVKNKQSGLTKEHG